MMDDNRVRRQLFGRGNTELDPSVASELPEKGRVVSTTTHAASFWGHTGRIDVELEDGTPVSYFIKIVSNSQGKNMFHGEYESMKAIHAVVPDFAPVPMAWGALQSAPGTYFFLCEYREMKDGAIPGPDEFARRLAALHQDSVSPTGKFGFHTPTYSGNLPQTNEWESSWETFFSRNLKLALELEIKAKGADPEFDSLVPTILDRVIPRLLRPLESDGRSVKPSLVHGDLWYANSGVDTRTGQPLVFDACSFYAHNEYEFGQWMPTCNKFGAEYREAYHRHVDVSPPTEDYQGRLDLYKLRFNTQVSALFPLNRDLREQMLGDMRDLVKRYGE